MTAVLAPATDVSTAGAAPPSTSSPAGAAPRAAEISTGALDRLVQRLRTDGKAVAVTAELRRGARTWTFDAGRARRAPARTVQPGSSFRAASVTKQLVAVLALQLVEKGTWTLDTTIGDVDPGLWPGREAITVRQLLSHTSGMPDHLGAVVAEATTGRKFVRAISRRSTDQEIIALGRSLPWAAEPGTFSYSNTGYVVVGQMLERATGTSVRRLVERRILRPVGMTDSAFAVSKSSPRPGLHEYARWPGRTLDLRSFEPSLFSSAGALVSTARDLNEFRRALEAGELIGKRWVRVMQHPLTDQGYGLGSYRLPSPCSSGPRWVHGHDGGSFGTLTFSVGLGGNRQLTIAMTGRGYTEDTITSQSRLLQKFAYTALAATCADDRKDRRKDRRPGGAPEWPQLLDVVAARAPAS
ncbi:beta-lactamase family protein [Nocardioides sp. zg-1308]|uniref:serine hydrolase domain-containing protein n=1 Tax=Nocardioides TaxID=1839 RepID=UPI0015549919|nr:MULTISPECIES: serine hydrolase domain-containing protein [unclassified Nocardioides]NPD06034.1 beta-lactamase family protein [Nocardioides sp. zg-1308]WQQ20438.1 serine hydrolase domain-containing protein [Nocardioides sp. S-34]